MKRHRLLVFAAVLAACTAISYPGTRAQESKAPIPQPQVRTLMEQRCEVLRQLVRESEERIAHDQDRSIEKFRSLTSARSQLLQAEIALTSDRKEVLRLLDAARQNAKAFEDQVRVRSERAEIILQAQADSLAAEIAFVVAAEGD